MSRNPPSGPPISRTVPPPNEFSALALLSTDPVPTMAGMRAWAAGAYSTLPVFSAISAAYSTQYLLGPVPASMDATAAADIRLAAIIRRRRSYRSAMTPATGPSSSSGKYSAATVSPVSRSEPVTSRT